MAIIPVNPLGSPADLEFEGKPVDLEEVRTYAEWLASRPQSVQDTAAKYPPERLYRLKKTGQRGEIIAYGEDGTVRLLFPMELNYNVDTEVFGIDPADLEECDDCSPTFMAQCHTTVRMKVHVSMDEGF